MRRASLLFLAATAAAAFSALEACGGASEATLDGSYHVPGASGGSGTAGAAGGVMAVADGLPCDVASLLATRCDSCHGTAPSGGAPISIVTYADLMAPSPQDPKQTVAEMSITRMQDAKLPMPPKPEAGATAAEIAILQSWVAGGAQKGTCGAGGTGGSGTGASGAAGSGAGGSGSVDGLPCDIAAFVAANCLSCHGSPLAGGAPMTLLSYADFTKASLSDPTKTNAQRSSERLVDPTSPMPPGGGLASGDIQTFQAWVAAGATTGTCTGAGGGTSVSPPEPCPAGQQGTTSTDADSQMNPGLACMSSSCHGAAVGEAPKLAFAGTIYPSGKNYEGVCKGVNGPSVGPLTVSVVDSTGKTFTSVPVDPVGNFYLRASQAKGFTPPYSMTQINDTKSMTVVNHMATAQTTGDCNSCHTPQGENGAPGRIWGP